MPELDDAALAVLLVGPTGAATVLNVGDGDTLRVGDGGKRLTIRMACIDAPETAQRPYGPASRQRLQGLAPVGALVTLRTPQTIDKYGHTLAEVFCDGWSINLAMVSSGQAFAYRKYLSACDQSAYLELKPPRNRGGSACGPCLGGSSGRGIGAMAPGLPHPLPPLSRLRLAPQGRPWPLLAATAAGSSHAARSVALPALRSC